MPPVTIFKELAMLIGKTNYSHTARGLVCTAEFFVSEIKIISFSAICLHRDYFTGAPKSREHPKRTIRRMKTQEPRADYVGWA